VPTFLPDPTPLPGQQISGTSNLNSPHPFLSKKQKNHPIGYPTDTSGSPSILIAASPETTIPPH